MTPRVGRCAAFRGGGDAPTAKIMFWSQKTVLAQIL
jgi:hypothetical protein